MYILISMVNIGNQITVPNIMYSIRRTRPFRARIKSSSFFWSHWSHASNFFAPGIFVKQNSNWAVLYDEI